MTNDTNTSISSTGGRLLRTTTVVNLLWFKSRKNAFLSEIIMSSRGRALNTGPYDMMGHHGFEKHSIVVAK